ADFGQLARDAVVHGAHVMNNSWGDDDRTGLGYTASARQFDQLARDPCGQPEFFDSLAIVFAAGNSGPAATSIESPKEAKNVVSVGASVSGKASEERDLRGLWRRSSRGPAQDGRLLPTVVAPGTTISGARSAKTFWPATVGTGMPDPADPAHLINEYSERMGTSMACPHVAGGCALLIEWWRKRRPGTRLSHAML